MTSPLAFVHRARALKRFKTQLVHEREVRRANRLEAETPTQQAPKPQCIERPDLVAYASALSWPYEPFEYFRPYGERLELAIGADFQIYFHAPPQHGKTEFTLRAFLYWARFFPGYKHAYVTYNEKQAQTVAKDFQRLAREAGFAVGGTLDIVVLDGTTRVKFTSIQGTLTGYALSGACVMDDLVKDADEALSPTVREQFKRWWRSTARTRRHPGTSFIGMGTRWHPDDPGGYLIKHEGFQYIKLQCIARPANSNDIDDEGRVISDPLHRLPGESLAKWKPPEFFAREQTDRHTWEAMYQGEPVAQGAAVFAEPGTIDEVGTVRGATFYRELPKDGYRGAFGIDLAYTAKTSADWSICIEGIAIGEKLYVVDVVRKQVEATSFALALKAKTSARPGWPMRWYAAGTEKGSAQFIRQALRSGGVAGPDPLKVFPPIGDKFTRALGVSARWNAGNVLLPDPQHIKAPWLPDFLAIVLGFTGKNDDHDDDVDALAALHDQLMKRNRMLEALGHYK